jgi:hypothetical protein
MSQNGQRWTASVVLIAVVIGCGTDAPGVAADSASSEELPAVLDVAVDAAETASPDLPADTDATDAPQTDVACISSCALRECGTDACGESCGECPSGATCSGYGFCEPAWGAETPSAVAHTLDGVVTGYGQVPAHEWSDITPLETRHGRLYLDWDGFQLHVLLTRPEQTAAPSPLDSVVLELATASGSRLLSLLTQGGGGLWLIYGGRVCDDCA